MFMATAAAMAMAIGEASHHHHLLKPYSLVVVVVVVVVVPLILLFRRRRRRSPRRVPPSPRGIALPVLGHLHLLGPLPHRALRDLSLRRGAPLLRLRLGSVPCVAASSAAAAAALLRGPNDPRVADRPLGAAVRRLTYGAADFSFAPHGPYWRFVKKLCVERLLGARTLDRLRGVRREEVRDMISAVRRNAAESVPLDVGRELIRLTNNVISRMMMGRRSSGTDGEAEDARKIVEEVAELVGKFNISDYIGFCKNWDLQGFDKRLDDVHRRFDAMVERVMKEKEAARARRRKEEEEEGGGGKGEEDAGKDLLDILLDIYEDEGAEMRLSRENIKAFILVQIINLFIIR